MAVMGSAVRISLWIIMTFCTRLTTIGVLAQNPVNAEELETRIDDMVAAILECRNIVGLSLAVVKGNQTLVTKGYGSVDLETEAEVTETTLFGIASLTKAFTATLLGQVLTENEYTWDTPVRSILGDEFYLYDPLRTYHVTSRDIGSHRTGIPRNNYARMQAPTREEMARKLRYMEPTLPFRSSYHYSNLMYGLMTYMTESLEGRSWEDLTRERIFHPLDMMSSTFTHEADLTRPDIAKPYRKTITGEWKQVALKFHSDWGALGGSGAILSNAADMAQWLRLQVNGGMSPQGQQVISKDVLAETHVPANILPEQTYAYKYRQPSTPITFAQDSYALGWRRGSYRGLRLSVHTGTSWGYGGLIFIIHDQDIAVFTAITGTDEEYMGRYLLQMYIIDLLLGVEPWVDTETVCSFPLPWNQPPETPATEPEESAPVEAKYPLEAYTGTFGNFAYGNITFSVNSEGNLELHYGELGLWLLQPQGGNRFKGFGRGYIWMRNLPWVEFTDEGQEPNDIIQEAHVPFDKLLPPVFVRDLKMSDAPPPEEGCGAGISSALLKFTSDAPQHMCHGATMLGFQILSLVFYVYSFY